MGAAYGERGIPARFLSGLHARKEIEKEIDAFITELGFAEVPAAAAAS